MSFFVKVAEGAMAFVAGYAVYHKAEIQNSGAWPLNLRPNPPAPPNIPTLSGKASIGNPNRKEAEKTSQLFAAWTSDFPPMRFR
jgi:hypothetical protein